jgi:uncharacterized protein
MTQLLSARRKSMSRAHVAFLAGIGVVALCGSAAPQARETPAAVKDPISPADCLKDKRKAFECQLLGLRYASGENVPQDEARAIGLFDAACRAGLTMSCGLQGWHLLRRQQGPDDVKRGEQLLDRGCKEGALVACDMLGRAYADGIGVARDVPKGAKLLGKTCDAGFAPACAGLAELLAAGDGIPRDVERAKALMGNVCAHGSARACETGCDWGDVSACVALGNQLAQGKDPDATRIDRAYERACSGGAVDGCFYLGLRTADAAQALRLFESACSLDDALGCFAVAQSYHVGRGVAVDLARAAGLYAKACDKDLSAACRALGGMYARGELGSGETAKGQAYFVKACGEDIECRAILANGRIPSAWGGSLEALRPRETVTRVEGPVRVGGAIREPRKTKDVSPTYPPIARMARIQGTVSLECTISPRGDVTDVKVVNSIPLLDEPAARAARQWRYAPTLIDGMPVPVIMTVTVNFKIR